MRSGSYVISQITSKIHREALNLQVKKYNGIYKVKHFGCRQQFIAMAFAQLTWREGLRDIVDCLNAQPEALHHLGFTGPLAKSPLADANESRDWRIWEGVAKGLMILPAGHIPELYRMRWQIELFFRWIKQHLKIRHFYGNSKNAVKTQILISVIVYLIVAILHKELKLPAILHRTFQILSTCPFSQITLHELLMRSYFKLSNMLDFNQLEFNNL